MQETLREQTGFIFNPCRRNATPRSKALFAETGSILPAEIAASRIKSGANVNLSRATDALADGVRPTSCYLLIVGVLGATASLHRPRPRTGGLESSWRRSKWEGSGRGASGMSCSRSYHLRMEGKWSRVKCSQERPTRRASSRGALILKSSSWRSAKNPAEHLKLQARLASA